MSCGLNGLSALKYADYCEVCNYLGDLWHRFLWRTLMGCLTVLFSHLSSAKPRERADVLVNGLGFLGKTLCLDFGNLSLPGVLERPLNLGELVGNPGLLLLSMKATKLLDPRACDNCSNGSDHTFSGMAIRSDSFLGRSCSGWIGPP